MQRQDRIAAFDVARSAMMLLGIVVHSLLIVEFFVPTVSDFDSAMIRSTYNAIHLFRMPVFFIVAGFFAAYLIREQGTRAFVVSRFKRVVSPLIAAEIFVAVTVFNHGCSWCENPTEPGWGSVLEHGWLYLWFLVYLVIISHGALLVHLALAKLRFDLGAIRTWVSTSTPLHILGLAVLASLLPNVLDEQGQLRVVTTLVPDPSILGFFALLFWAGWIAQTNQKLAMEQLKRWWWLNLSVGLVLNSAWHVASIWFVSFGLLGLLLVSVKRSSALGEYLSDASYWIYLVHPPIVIALMALLAQQQLSVFVLLGLVQLLTLAITVGSYQLAIRHTIVGKWLSGRRRLSRKQAAALVAGR